MSDGYYWCRYRDGTLFVALIVNDVIYAARVDGSIDPAEVDIVCPVKRPPY